MSEKDEQGVEQEEVAETTSEQQEDGPDFEGHKMHMGEAEKVSEPGKAY